MTSRQSQPASGPFPDGGAAQHAAQIAISALSLMPIFFPQPLMACPSTGSFRHTSPPTGIVAGLASGQRPARTSDRVGRFLSVTGRLLRPAFCSP